MPWFARVWVHVRLTGARRAGDHRSSPLPQVGSPNSPGMLGGLMESVDDWPMAIRMHTHSGGTRSLYPLPGVTGGWDPPPKMLMSQPAPPFDGGVARL